MTTNATPSTATPAQAAAPLPSNLLLTFSEVAALLGCDRTTIRDRRKGGRYPNADKDLTAVGTWRIPVQDLLNAGDIDASQVLEVGATLPGLRESAKVGALQTRIAELEQDLAVQAALAQERQAAVASLQKTVDVLLAVAGAR